MPPQCTCCATGSSSGTHEVYRNLVETISVSGARARERPGSWPFSFPVHVPGKDGNLAISVSGAHAGESRGAGHFRF